MDTNIMLTCIIVLLLISVGLSIFNTYKIEQISNDNPFHTSNSGLSPSPNNYVYKNIPNYQDSMMGMEEIQDMDTGPTNGMRRTMQSNMNGLQGALPDMAVNLGGTRGMDLRDKKRDPGMGLPGMGPPGMGHPGMGPPGMGPPIIESSSIETFAQSPAEMYRRFNSR